MTEELNLEEISSTTASESNDTVNAEVQTTEEPVEATESAETPVTATNTIDSCVKLYDLLTSNTDKLVDCHQIDISGIEESKAYNYLMYATDLEKDKSLILVPKAEQIAILSEYVANIVSIRVMESGVVIISDNARVYVNMSGTTHFAISAEGATAAKVMVSKIKKDACTSKNCELPARSSDVDAIRQMVKFVSIRMLPAIEKETTVEGFRSKALEFMSKIRDVNHLLKIENEILAKL